MAAYAVGGYVLAMEASVMIDKKYEFKNILFLLSPQPNQPNIHFGQEVSNDWPKNQQTLATNWHYKYHY